MSDSANEMAIVRPENISVIASQAPVAFQENMLSRRRCVETGEQLSKEISRNGMDDVLDMKAAAYIEKSRKTVVRMRERRSAVTKLFDDIRGRFTEMENSIDPSKEGSLPWDIQRQRNAFAAKKKAEEDRRRHEEMMRQMKEQSMSSARMAIENAMRLDFQSYLEKSIQTLSDLYEGTTLANYDETVKRLNDYPCEVPEKWISDLSPWTARPQLISEEEMASLRDEVKAALKQKFMEQYRTEVSDYKSFIFDRMPSKKTNLENIAKAEEKEAEELRRQMEDRQKREAEEKEAERRKREAEEASRSVISRAKDEMGGLFDMQAAAVPEYRPNMKVTKRISLKSPKGILAVVSMWWYKTGKDLPLEDLKSIFKKQLAFCEKIANKENEFIEDPDVEYVDDVKAK